MADKDVAGATIPGKAGSVRSLTSKPPVPPGPHRYLRTLLIVAFLLAFLFAGVFLLLRFSGHAKVGGKTIAVIPFTDPAAGRGQEYFSDGISEEIIAQLTRTDELNVISRASAMEYRGTRKSVQQIGRELNAGFVLNGYVRHSGDRIRISAHLFDAAAGSELWAKTYDREFSRILTVYNDIGQAVAAALEISLSDDPERAPVPRAEINTAAYDLLLQGNSCVNLQTLDGLNKAVDLYRRALAIDQKEARVWAALAEAYLGLADSLRQMGGELLDKAREAAKRAIALDGKLAGGHLALASVLAQKDWNWQEAALELRSALDLEPGSAVSIGRQAALSLSRGDVDDAIAFGERAAALDPLVDPAHAALGLYYWYGDRADESIASSRKALVLNAACPQAHFRIACAYLAQSRMDTALGEVRLEPDEARRLQGLSIIHHAAKQKQESDLALTRLIQLHSGDAPFQIAEAYAFREEEDRALEWLNNASRARDPGLRFILGDPLLRSLERDPRYAAFLRKLNLAD